ncbi:MAG: hypothetical protein JW909_06370, partial [Planctomycetes bacterium]|nr:hypothetical protein [Planctomycetota bacterium]
MKKVIIALVAVCCFYGVRSARAAETGPVVQRTLLALPSNTVTCIYGSGYGPMKEAFNANPLVRMMKSPAFAPVKSHFWGKLDSFDTFIRNVAGGQFAELSRFSGDEIIRAFNGPVAVAFPRDFIPMLIADISACRQENDALLQKFASMYMELSGGVAPEAFIHKGVDVVSFPMDKDSSLAYAKIGDLLVVGMGVDRVATALDAALDGNGLAASDGFRAALSHFDFSRVDVFYYADAPVLLEVVEAEDKGIARAMLVAGVGSATYVVLAEERGRLGIVDRLVVG